MLPSWTCLLLSLIFDNLIIVLCTSLGSSCLGLSVLFGRGCLFLFRGQENFQLLFSQVSYPLSSAWDSNNVNIKTLMLSQSSLNLSSILFFPSPVPLDCLSIMLSSKSLIIPLHLLICCGFSLVYFSFHLLFFTSGYFLFSLFVVVLPELIHSSLKSGEHLCNHCFEYFFRSVGQLSIIQFFSEILPCFVIQNIFLCSILTFCA